MKFKKCRNISTHLQWRGVGREKVESCRPSLRFSVPLCPSSAIRWGFVETDRPFRWSINTFCPGSGEVLLKRTGRYGKEGTGFCSSKPGRPCHFSYFSLIVSDPSSSRSISNLSILCLAVMWDWLPQEEGSNLGNQISLLLPFSALTIVLQSYPFPPGNLRFKRVTASHRKVS